MFSFFYNTSLFLVALAALPKLLWNYFVCKKYRKSLKARLGFGLPKIPPKSYVIWIHAISMGETRAALPLFKKLRAAHPHAAILISSTTETGHEEAKRIMADAQAHFFLPFDFSWIMKKTMRHLSPNLLVLIESDLWYHFVSYAKKQGAKVVLVNGKISERSTRRFGYASFFAKKLWKCFDLLCVQSELHAKRFALLSCPLDKIYATGNIKLDASPVRLSEEEKRHFKADLGIHSSDPVLVLGSTHAPEEKLFLQALEKVWEKIPSLKVIFVPRHPERFKEVALLFQDKGMLYSQKEHKTGKEKIILIDAMGLLLKCYQIADLSLVGGSFTDKVGGHNIFEPLFFGVPVLFGPHMHAQTDLVSLVKEGKAGLQLSMHALPSTILSLLQHPTQRETLGKAGLSLTYHSSGATERTIKAIERVNNS